MDGATTRQIGEYAIARIVTGSRWTANCYLVTHLSSREQVLIDPGNSVDDIRRVLADSGGKLRHVLLTHAHFDHVGGVAAVCGWSGLSCRIHQRDERLLRHAPMYAELFAHEKIPMPEPCEPFDGEPELEFSGERVGTLHLPGHTAGSVCWVFAGFAFTGDTLLYEAVGRTDLPGGDKSLLHVSVPRLIKSLPDGTVLFPGHGQEWSAAEAEAWWARVSSSPPQFTLTGVSK